MTVIWTGGHGDAVVQAATRPAGGTFSAPVDLVTTGGYPSTDVATNAAGQTVAVWTGVGAGPSRVVQAATRSADGAFSAPVDVSVAGRDADDPHVAIDAAGNAVVVWTRSDGATRVVQFAPGHAGHAFATAIDLSLAGGEARAPKLAVNPAGDAVVAWQRSDGANTIVQAAVARAGAGFAPPTDMSLAGDDAVEPQVGIDDDGDAIVAWRRSAGAATIVQAAGYDAVGPQLRGLSIPGTVAVGTAAIFSLSALDVWSSVTSTLWSFSDGQTAAGASVSHAFAAIGDHTVTVTATDALAQATSATRTVTVSPPTPQNAPTPAMPPAPRAPSAPSNRFAVITAKATAGGVIRLVLRARSAGAYRAVATNSRSPKRRLAYGRGRATARRAGRVRLTIRPTRAAKRRLAARPIKVAVAVTFKPTGGAPRTKRLTIPAKATSRD